MLEHDFEQSVGFWIGMTSRVLERALNEELAPHGITSQQWQVLGWLALEGQLTQAELAERMRLEAPTLVGILDRMERDGWIVRQPSATDRRKKLICPTPRVQPVWRKIMSGIRRVRARAFRGLTPQRMKLVIKVLAAIQENLRTEKMVREAV